jgi:hypothetical protein
MVGQVFCFYFVFTVSATVGFGDVSAVNTSERVCLPHSPAHPPLPLSRLPELESAGYSFL